MKRLAIASALGALILVATGCSRQAGGGGVSAVPPGAGQPADSAAHASAAGEPALVTQQPLAVPPPRTAASPAVAAGPAAPGAGPQPAAEGGAAPHGPADLEDVIEGMEALVASAMSLQKALLTSHPSGQAATEQARQELEKKKAADGEAPTEQPADAAKEPQHKPAEPEKPEDA